MTVSYQYYRISEGPTHDAWLQIRERRDAVYDEIRPSFDALGVTRFSLNHLGRISSVELTTPDPTLWKSTRSGYYPRKNTLAGKALLAKFEAFPKIPDPKDCIHVAGLSHGFPGVMEGLCWYDVQVIECVREKVLFVGVPKLDKATENQPDQFAEEGPHVSWTPPEDWNGCAEWEMRRDIEHFNKLRIEANDLKKAA